MALSVKLKALCLLFVALCLSGCSSSLVLGKVYDGFGSSTAKRFKSYASFNEEQTRQIDSLAESYHSWHRTTQLQRYSGFISSILEEVGSGNELSIDAADRWWKRARGFTDDLRACNPLNVSSQLLASLSDQQVSQVAAKMRLDLNEREDEYRAETKQQRLERRVEEITKWGRRSSISFNDAQTEALRKTLQNQISLGSERYELRRIWMEEFIQLLSARDQADFDSLITRHIASVWSITQSAFPDQWSANEKIWTAFVRDFINLQSQDQRLKMISKMTAVGETLQKLANKKTSVVAVCHQLDP